MRFDPNFSYCEDCEVGFRSRMLKANRCDPEFVRDQFRSMAVTP